jgi:hypothetical protein
MASEVDLDLASLFFKAFGTPASVFEPNLQDVRGDTSLSRTEQSAIGGSPYYANDLVLGVEYFMPVTLIYPDTAQKDGLVAPLIFNGNNVSGRDSGSTGVLREWNLPFPLITITAKKTLLTERRGTVKELIQLKDYDITIKGFLIAGTNDYPEDLVTTLRNIYEINGTIGIKSPLTDIFLLRSDSSDQVVITEMHLPGLKGVKNVEPYELKLVSDSIFNLIDIS